MIHLSARSRNTPASPIRRLTPLARAAQEKGVTPYYLNIGQPDLECPSSFGDGIRMHVGTHVTYAPSEGYPEFREAWAEWVNKELGIKTPVERYLVTVGASEGLVFLFTAVCDPMDEIIIFDPTYANYMGFAEQTGVRLVSLASAFDDGFKLPDTAVIRKHITSRTRAILLCNPNNPTGVVYCEEEVQRLLDICHRYGLYLIVDETYRELVFDNRPISTALQFAADDPHVIVVDSLSKRFSLCGARIGTLYVPSDGLREKILHLAQARLAAPSLEQMAATHMLHQISDDYLSSVRSIYQSRRDALVSSLRKIEGVTCCEPSGAFYFLAKLPVGDAEKFARFMLSEYSQDDHTVFVAPARGFYSIPGMGEDEVRLAFVLDEERLKHAAEILEGGIKAFVAS